MAIDLGNPFDKRPPKKALGAGFEFQVRERLRMQLPNDYVLRQGIVVTEAEKYTEHNGELIRRTSFGGSSNYSDPKQSRRAPTIREIDFVVAGPNGVFFIETKCFHRIRGGINGEWEFWVRENYGNRSWRRIIRNEVPPADKMQKVLAKFKTLCFELRKNLPLTDPVSQALENHQYAQVVFVFPEGAQIEVNLEHDAAARSNKDFRLGSMQLLTLDKLVSTIINFKVVGKKPMTHQQSRAMIEQVLIPGSIEEPSIIGNFKIVKRGATQQAANGVRYKLMLLEHVEHGNRVWGKRYDTQDLAAKDRSLFEQQVKRHATVIAQIKHPNIHQFYDSFSDPYDNSYWVLEEWIDGRRLSEILDANETQNLNITQIMQQIAAGLSALHRSGKTYRELNPNSVLIETDTQRAILTDFEVTRATNLPTVANSQLSANPYRAPEWTNTPTSADARSDIYSWAAIYFRLLTGETYSDENQIALLSEVKLSLSQKDLIVKCLANEQAQRPSSLEGFNIST